MNLLGRIALGLLLVGGLTVVIFHHIAYLRRARSHSFAAFLETAGWIVISLVALTALGGALADARSRTIELAATIVGALSIGIGHWFK